MKSLRSKMLAIAVLPVIFCTIVIGAIGVNSISNLMTMYSEEVLISLANEQGATMDKVFENVEHSCDIMSTVVSEKVSSIEDLADPDFINDFNTYAREVILNLAANSEYADSMYIRFNPKYAGGLSGIFYIRNGQLEQKNATWEEAPLTDLSNIENESSDVYAWWNEPVSKGQPVWVMPHEDNVLKVDAISYCIPVYVKGELVCVAGVDTRVSVVAKYLKSINIYETGSAFLTNEDEYIMYHPSQENPGVAGRIERDSEEISKILKNIPKDKQLTFYTNPDNEYIALADKELTSGMHLIVSARTEDIYADRHKMIIRMLMGMVLILAILIIFVSLFIKKLIKPIRELINASEQISKGNIDAVILQEYKRDDEIGRLNESLRNTMSFLRKYINRVNSLAFTDLMTGVNNKTSYLENISKMNDEINQGCAKFSITVFDVNNLKYVNDTYGHEFGDKLIMGASKTICSCFKHSMVFRIGGDEFAVISTGEDYDNREDIVERFKNKVRAGIPIGKDYDLVIACGMSVYEENDLNFDDVFNRADKAMYLDKTELKSRG